MAKRLPAISVVRVYDLDNRDRGYRVLVDRLWPRGRSKEQLRIDEWTKDLAPSDDLRRWFDHRPERWNEFRKRYRIELGAQHELVDRLAKLSYRRRLALLFGARDVEHNNAVALREHLESRRLELRRTPQQA